MRCGVGRHGSAIQPRMRARAAAALRTKAADCADDADSGGTGRRSEDVEKAQQCQSHYSTHRRAVRDASDHRGSEIEVLKADVVTRTAHPMELKKRLARTIAAGFHGESAAQHADENW